jgi:hypothetical protein
MKGGTPRSARRVGLAVAAALLPGAAGAGIPSATARASDTGPCNSSGERGGDL